jgi:hypothetical protein
VELKLDTFFDKEDILRALSSMQIVDGFNNTRIDSALKAAQSDMFAPANGVRAYIPKVLVFLASGDASDQNLQTAATPLKDVGTTIIPLVTGDLETRTIAPIGSSTLHYFASDNFGNLATKLDAISAKLCQGKVSSCYISVDGHVDLRRDNPRYVLLLVFKFNELYLTCGRIIFLPYFPKMGKPRNRLFVSNVCRMSKFFLSNLAGND